MKRTILAIAILGVSFSANAMFLCSNEYGETVTWQVGQAAPSFNLGNDLNKVSCAASDNELAFIRSHYDGIPQRGTDNTRVTFWRGMDAVFIIDNLGKNL